MTLRTHRRFYLALAAGAAVAAALPGLPLTERLLVGGDLFFVSYLVATLLGIRGRTGDDLRDYFAAADEGGAAIVLVALAAVMGSLYAITDAMVNAAGDSAGAGWWATLRPLLALGAVPLGWAMVHTVMAFHYARLYYAQEAAVPGQSPSDRGGLDFPGDCPEPGPWEFLYYSFTLGMTAQTSDTGLTSTQMRRVTLAHSVLSFFYNAVIVALAVNAGMALASAGGSN